MLAPMIKNLWDVLDASSLFRRAEGKIVILGKIEFLAKNADALDERTQVNSEVADIHRGKEKLGAPIGLEIGRVPSPFQIATVFVAVENFRVGRAKNRAGQFVNGKRREEIIVINAGDEITGRHL